MTGPPRRRSIVCAILLLPACGDTTPSPDPVRPQCDRDNGGISLPAGFCAAVFADNLGAARHMVVSPAGVLYVALETGGEAAGSRHRTQGGVLALRDTTGDGRADVITEVVPGGGTGIALRGDTLWFSTPTTVQRVRLDPGGMAAAGPPHTIVDAIPGGGHSSRSLALDDEGHLFISVGSASNVCTLSGLHQGPEPCPELPARAGIWRYDAARPRQHHPADGAQWARGLRNAVGLAWDTASKRLLAVSHGRDALANLWPRLYTPRESAEQPSEEFVVVERGDDFGWPYCFHDNRLGRLVLAPEYGGDATTSGRCAALREPIIGFPGHWGPDGLLIYGGSGFPARYRGGAFIAFHGSWNRAPMPQAGYKVVFVPRTGAGFGPAYETFADGFAGGHLDPGTARHRPVGLAEGPDGTLYISDDQRGRIWRVVPPPR